MRDSAPEGSFCQRISEFRNLGIFSAQLVDLLITRDFFRNL
jgi:hypothetical protein